MAYQPIALPKCDVSLQYSLEYPRKNPDCQNAFHIKAYLSIFLLTKVCRPTSLISAHLLDTPKRPGENTVTVISRSDSLGASSLD